MKGAWFSIIDPGRKLDPDLPDSRREAGSGPSALGTGQPIGAHPANAVVLADSRGDHRQAARILDGALARPDAADDVVELVEALVYRAEVAMVTEDWTVAGEPLSRVRRLDLTAEDRRRLAATLDTAAELAAVLRQ
jgi:hypothetical protein